MTENMKAIIKAAAEDQALKDQVTALAAEFEEATDETRPELVARAIAIASDRGFTLTEEDFAFEPAKDRELDDEEMKLVSGGWSVVEICGDSEYYWAYID